MIMRNLATALIAATVLTSSQWTAHADPYPRAPAYATALDPTTTTIKPFLTVGDSLPLSHGTGKYLVVGIPDGLGLYRKGEHVILLSNHEFLRSQGGPALPLRGGARVSEFTLSIQARGAEREITVLSGQAAIGAIFEDDTMVTDTTRRFCKLCSATLADARVGFDRPIFMTSEELSGDSTFDRRGGPGYAVFGGSAYALPRLGRFRAENRVPVPFTGRKTVVFGLEDDDKPGQFSQLYMYVGDKQPGARDALSINGLDNGSLHVFVAADPSIHDESYFKKPEDELEGRWMWLDWNVTESSLEAAARAANAFTFVRVEDGAANPGKKGEFWFVTTGDDSAMNGVNPYGRLYRLNFDPKDPSGRRAKLTLVLAGSQDGMVSPDNIDINRQGEIAICEDPNYHLDSPRFSRRRDTYFWIYDIASKTLNEVATLARDSASADTPRVLEVEAAKNYPGSWEFSGVVDAEDYLGRGAWILDVQAHSLRVRPRAETVEGGQYLQVIWRPKKSR
jgi:hypothetical protein